MSWYLDIFVPSYEFETSVRWVVNSTHNSSPCQGDSAGDQPGISPQVPSTGGLTKKHKESTQRLYYNLDISDSSLRRRVQLINVDIRAPGECLAGDRGDTRSAPGDLLHR